MKSHVPLLMAALALLAAGCKEKEAGNDGWPRSKILVLVADSTSQLGIPGATVAIRQDVADSLVIRDDSVLYESPYFDAAGKTGVSGDIVFWFPETDSVPPVFTRMIASAPGYRLWRFDAQRDSVEVISTVTNRLRIRLMRR